MRALLGVAVIALLLSSASCQRGGERRGAPRDSAAADTASPVDSLPPLPASVLDVPVEYDLDPAIAALETAVPRRFGDLAQRRPVPTHPRLSIAFAAQRSPFTVRVRGQTATIEALVDYQGKGWYNVRFAPDVGASCGTDGAPPRLRVALQTTVRLAPDWTLRSQTRVPIVEPASDSARDRCRVTVLKYDVTERVLAAARTQLEGKAALVDARLARTDVRSRVANWWALLQRPIRVRDSLWLEIRPAYVRVGRLHADGDALVAPVRLTANPRLVSGPRPDSTTIPLPPLEAAAPGEIAGTSAADTGLRVRLDAELDYASATSILVSKVVGREFARAGRRVVVRSAAVRPASGGRVALTIDVAGAAAGVIRLVGRPTFDPTLGELRVPDLEYDVASDNVVVRGLDWLKHDELRDTLRARARWLAAELVEKARAKLEQALNRDLTKGVRLVAEVPAARVLDVRARPEGIVLRAEAAGSAALRVSRPVRMRRSAVATRPPAPTPPAR
jgi:hypothetical protein